MLCVLLSRIMNVTWVKVLASFSMKQGSINCSGRSSPRFQGTYSANDLLLNARGREVEREKLPWDVPLPRPDFCSPSAKVQGNSIGTGSTHGVIYQHLYPMQSRQKPQYRFLALLPLAHIYTHPRKASKMLEMQLHTTSLFICSLRGMRHLYFFLSLPAPLKKELFEGHLKWLCHYWSAGPMNVPEITAESFLPLNIKGLNAK